MNVTKSQNHNPFNSGPFALESSLLIGVEAANVAAESCYGNSTTNSTVVSTILSIHKLIKVEPFHSNYLPTALNLTLFTGP